MFRVGVESNSSFFMDLTERQQQVVKDVGTIISGNEGLEVKIIGGRDTSHTDGNIAYISKDGGYRATIGKMAHNSGHVRYEGIFHQKVFEKINEKYPKHAAIVLGMYEDYRVDHLNGKVFPGWIRDLKDYQASLGMLYDDDKFKNTLNSLGYFMNGDRRFNDDNTFDIWETAKKTKIFVEKYLSKESTVIASKMMLDKILSLYDIENPNQPPPPMSPGPSTSPNTDGNKAKTSINIAKDYEAGAAGDIKKLMSAAGKLGKSKEKMERIIEKMKHTPTPLGADYLKLKLEIENFDPLKYTKKTDYLETIRENKSVIKRLKREWSRLNTSTAPGRGGRRGRLMSRDLIKYITDPNKTFDRVFQKDRRAAGANLMLFIDNSGSTHGFCLNKEREIAIILSEALKETNINFSIIGFSAQSGVKRICEVHYKDFGVPVVKERLENMDIPGHHSMSDGFYENRDGDSMEYAIRHFNKTNKKHPVMIVLSDGMPNHSGTDYGYGSRAVKATRSSIRKLRQRGITLHGVGIGVDGDYEAMYDDKDVTIINEVQDLESTLLNLIRGIAAKVNSNF